MPQNEHRPSSARLIPPVYFIAGVISIYALNKFAPVATIIPEAWSWVGVVPFVTGAGIMIYAERMFKAAQTTIKPFHDSSALVTSGPFRYSRNPIYLSMVLVLMGFAVFKGTVTPFATIPVLAVALNYLFIVPEEKMLRQTFGEDYEQYCMKVRRWL